MAHFHGTMQLKLLFPKHTRAPIAVVRCRRRRPPPPCYVLMFYVVYECANKTVSSQVMLLKDKSE
jgi:hypothetical protein